MRILRATILATLPVALAACGQKGPLVLPPPPPAQQSKVPENRPADRAYPDVPATTEKK
jgi:predicted small lipoprotein YifL